MNQPFRLAVNGKTLMWFWLEPEERLLLEGLCFQQDDEVTVSNYDFIARVPAWDIRLRSVITRASEDGRPGVNINGRFYGGPVQEMPL